jgi:hypothetical protein
VSAEHRLCSGTTADVTPHPAPIAGGRWSDLIGPEIGLPSEKGNTVFTRLRTQSFSPLRAGEWVVAGTIALRSLSRAHSKAVAAATALKAPSAHGTKSTFPRGFVFPQFVKPRHSDGHE